MSFTKDDVLNKIERVYGTSYDVIRHDENSTGLLMEAEFHVHTENYVISKKAQLYQMDSNEYVYLFYYPELSLDLFNEVINKAYELGYEKITPGPNHRSSYVVAEFICDTVCEDAYKALKKYRKRKSFQFSFHGWMETHAVLIDLGTESIIANGDGRLCGKFLKNVLHPKKRRGIRLF
ncbi:MAG: hypothetical protein Q4D29_10945 [Lachnospiraceae bacterium]|nr:hypothetical protein [Lachnospiraceae bacterium]